MKIGVIYIVTGVYADFWNDFYHSCEQFFCSDVDKGYEVFTDSEELLLRKYKNVRFHKIEDQGWIKNVSCKSYCICRIKELLLIYDFIFYLNGNYKVMAPISSTEIVPSECNGWITALSYDHYLNIPADEYPYDRNLNSKAFIPYGSGQRYYQGGFYGGRTPEFILLSEVLKTKIEKDLDKGIIARFHDESYLNKYLIDKAPRIVNEKIAYHNIWKYDGLYNGLFLDKEQSLGQDRMQKYKYKMISDSLTIEEKFIIQILNNALSSLELGLFGGKMGAAIILFLYSRLSGNLLYNRWGETLIERVYAEITNSIPLSFSKGLLGIGWGICFLIKYKFLSGEPQKVLEGLDDVIIEYYSRDISVYSITELDDILIYITMRSSFDSFEALSNLKFQHSLRINQKASTKNILEKILDEQSINYNIKEFKLLSIKNMLNTIDSEVAPCCFVNQS